jgi:hypothetical protein
VISGIACKEEGHAKQRGTKARHDASKPFPVTRAKENNDFSHALLRKV